MKQLSIDMELNNIDLNQLSNRIYILKEKIDLYLAEGLWQVEIAPEDIKEEDISSFPVDFRMLLKAIGTGILASHPNGTGYHVVNISIPYKPNDPDGDYIDWLDWDEWEKFGPGVCDKIFFDNQGLFNLNDILVIGHDIDNYFFGYSIIHKPYKLVIQAQSDFTDDFITFIEPFILNDYR